MIIKSTESLYAGIGYFLSSGFQKIQDGLIDIANNGSDVKIIAGNLYVFKDGVPIINPDLDIDTCELIVNLYEKANGKIFLRSVRDRFFHGKFFLGIGKEEAYLIGGSSNLSRNAIEKNRNIEYNFYTEDELNSEIIKINKEWFLNVWENNAVALNRDDVENLKFLINKAKFNIDVKEDIFEGGSKISKTKEQIQCEIIDNILRNIGFNTVQPVMKDEYQPNDIFVSIIHYLYRNKDNMNTNNVNNCIKSAAFMLRKDITEVAQILTEQIEQTSFREYYFDILKRILGKTVADRSKKPDYATLIKDVLQIFIEYYEHYHNKTYKKGSYSVTGDGKAKKKSIDGKKIEKKDFEFKIPKKVSNNRFEYLLRIIEKAKMNFEDDWMFQYQNHDAKAIVDRYDLNQKGIYLAHEAGMGKSAIICKFIKEAQRRKWDVRTLIACPASLLYQWKDDNLFRDFNIQSEIIDGDKLKKEGNAIWTNRKINIVSIDFLKNVIGKEEDLETIKAMSPDILIIDEAHLLKNDTAIRYENINKLKPKFVLLASATPLQNNVREFLVQLSLIDKNIDIDRANDIEYVKKLRDKYLIRKTRANDLVEIKTIKQAVRNVQKVEIPIDSQFKAIYDELEEQLKNGAIYYYKFLGEITDKASHYKNIDVMTSFMSLQQITSSVSACIDGFKNLKRKIEFIVNNDFIALNEEQISEFDTKEEREILSLLAENKHKITTEMIEKLQTDLLFIDDYINEQYGKLYKDGTPLKNPKEKMLLDLITNEKYKDMQCIIFVKYIATGKSIVDVLKKNGVAAEFFTGALSKVKRNEIAKQFRNGELQVLVATDAANAGLNLQSANFMINFDLNWNPQIVEQRIGRIHRIGQKADEVVILNLILQDTVDSRIAEKMKGKEETFTSIFVTSDEIIGSIAKMYMSSKSIEEFDIPVVEKTIDESIKAVFEENKEEIKKVNNEYYYQIEALREMLMWILDKYGIQYYTKDEQEYYLKLDDGEIYIINLNQVYNMIDKEHEFFRDFEFNSYITNEKHKEPVKAIENIYFTVEEQDDNKVREKIESLPIDSKTKEILRELIDINKESYLIQLNLNVEYLLESENGDFSKSEFKTVVITPDKRIVSDEGVIKFLSIMPVESQRQARFDTLDNHHIYGFIYNELLKDYLKREKNKEISSFDIILKDINIAIYSGTAYSSIK